jgi:hypothetical protein
VFALVERQGKVHSRHVADATAKTLREAIVKVASRKSHLMTDEAVQYIAVGKEFAGHSSVNHSADEYVRLGGFVHTISAIQTVPASASAIPSARKKRLKAFAARGSPIGGLTKPRTLKQKVRHFIRWRKRNASRNQRGP